MSGKFVLQVACGQQHSVCRAVERDNPAANADGAQLVGSDAGADVYVWGNGTLGQLGLGTSITSNSVFSCISNFNHSQYRQARDNERTTVSYAQRVHTARIPTRSGLCFRWCKLHCRCHCIRGCVQVIRSDVTYVSNLFIVLSHTVSGTLSTTSTAPASVRTKTMWRRTTTLCRVA